MIHYSRCYTFLHSLQYSYCYSSFPSLRSSHSYTILPSLHHSYSYSLLYSLPYSHSYSLLDSPLRLPLVYPHRGILMVFRWHFGPPFGPPFPNAATIWLQLGHSVKVTPRFHTLGIYLSVLSYNCGRTGLFVRMRSTFVSSIHLRDDRPAGTQSMALRNSPLPLPAVHCLLASSRGPVG